MSDTPITDCIANCNKSKVEVITGDDFDNNTHMIRSYTELIYP